MFIPEDDLYEEEYDFDKMIELLRMQLINDTSLQYLVELYKADFEEMFDFLKHKKFICQCSYELQCMIWDLYPEWYDEEIWKMYDFG